VGEGIGILVNEQSTNSLILDNFITRDSSNAKDGPIWVVGGASAFLSGNKVEGYQREIGAAPGAQIYSAKP
jgi:hypothetical protein